MTQHSIFPCLTSLIAIWLLSGAWAYPQSQSDATASATRTNSASSDPPGPSLTVKGHASDGRVPGGPYKCYKTAADFPNNTFPYELIWNTFLPIMKTSNSNKELEDLSSAITANVYGSDLVDQPLFLATFLQASGNLHLPPNLKSKTPTYGPLGMRWDPKLSSVSDCSGKAKTECSTDAISKMVKDSVYGQKEKGKASTSQAHTFYPPGIGHAYTVVRADKGYLSTAGPGAVARYFNTGSLPDKSDLTLIDVPGKGSIGSKHYVSDIGNWMMGVNAATPEACKARQACGINDPTDTQCYNVLLALAAGGIAATSAKPT